MLSRTKLPPLSDFRRDTKLLITASGLFSISFFGIQALLKVLYLLRLEYGLEYIGIFSATGALAYMTMSMPSGALGGRFGPRRIMLTGGVVTVIGMAILPLTESMPGWARFGWPIASQAVTSFGWSMFNVNLIPALMGATTARNRNSTYALNSMMKGLGTFVGTVCGGLLPGLLAGLLGQSMDAPAPYRLALWIGAILAVAGLIPLGLVKPVQTVVERTPAETTAPFPLLPFVILAAHVVLSQAGWATCQAFCNAYMDTDLRLSPAAIGALTGVGQFFAILAPLIAPRLARRYSNGWTLMAATLGIAVSLLFLALFSNWATAGIGRLGVMVLAAIRMPALQVYQMELVDSQRRSLAYGIISTVMGFGFASVGLAGGYIVAARGYQSLFLLGTVLSMAGSAVMWGMLKRPIPRVVSAGAAD